MSVVITESTTLVSAAGDQAMGFSTNAVSASAIAVTPQVLPPPPTWCSALTAAQDVVSALTAAEFVAYAHVSQALSTQAAGDVVGALTSAQDVVSALTAAQFAAHVQESQAESADQ